MGVELSASSDQSSVTEEEKEEGVDEGVCMGRGGMLTSLLTATEEGCCCWREKGSKIGGVGKPS